MLVYCYVRSVMLLLCWLHEGISNTLDRFAGSADLGILMGNPDGTWEILRAQEHPLGIPEARPGGRVEVSHGKLLLDLGVYAWVEHVLDMTENCSTPCCRPRIQPRRFWLDRISGRMLGVEQV